MTTYDDTKQILNEIDQVLRQIREEEVDALCRAILGADRLFLHSLGREGLVMRGFTMRLMHLGFVASVVGDMTTPPIGPGGLLIGSSGPGYVKSMATLFDIAHQAGGKVALLTAEPSAPLAQQADLVVFIPAQTMARAESQGALQLMGSLYEQAEWILLDAIVLRLKNTTRQTAEQIRQRHTNLE
ncbi:MAG: 6-phospho-3-hexuloisomerase [Anaerolineaceae bacterium]